MDRIRKRQRQQERQLQQQQQQPSQRRAYVTLLYNNFVAGTRALGRSLLDVGSAAEMVVLVTPDVSQRTRTILAKDGWRIVPVEVTANPNAGFQSRLVFVYTKLLIFNMVEYDKLVFLDSDTLVLENVDELFQCGPFCANMRQCELLNSGVLVVEPNADLYRDMHNKFAQLPSYTGGDQGFLNSWYSKFAECPLFEPYSEDAAPHAPNEPANDGGSGTGAHCWRLPSRYNGDWPLSFVDSPVQRTRHALPAAPPLWAKRKRVKIMHYTFGTGKPWNWWTYPFLPYVDKWAATYAKLSPGGGAASPAPLNPQHLRMAAAAGAPALLWWAAAALVARSPAAARAAHALRAAAAAAVPACVLGGGSSGGGSSGGSGGRCDSPSMPAAYACVGFGVALLGASVAAGAAVANAVACPGAPAAAAWVALAWAVTLFAAAAGAALQAVQAAAARQRRQQRRLRPREVEMGGAVASSSSSPSPHGGGGELRHKSRSPSLHQPQQQQQPPSPGHLEAAALLGDDSSSEPGGGSGGGGGTALPPHPLAASLAHLSAIAVLLSLLLWCGRIRGLDALPITGLIGIGVPIAAALLVQCAWSCVAVPPLWAEYGRAAGCKDGGALLHSL